MTTKTLETLLRRRGFYIIVGLLYDYPDGFTLKDLRNQLEARKTHYNNYTRVKEMLLKIKLITSSYSSSFSTKLILLLL